MKNFKQKKYSKSEELIIKIDDLTVDGLGVGKADGAVFFCAGLIPGERAKVKVIKAAKKYYIAKTIEILDSSKNRASPPCSVYKRCGGCSLQHMAYETQLEFKRNRVTNSFQRIGDLDIPIYDTVASPEEYNYRNKAIFPVSKLNDEIVVGFYAKNSHYVIDTDFCMIQHDRINSILKIIKSWLKEYDISVYDENSHLGLVRHIFSRVSSTGEVMAGLIVTNENLPNIDSLIAELSEKVEGLKSFSLNINSRKTNAVLGEKTLCVFGEKTISHEIDGLIFEVGLKSFLQVNTLQTEQLYAMALEYADIKDSDTVIDLFCGIGTITLLAAEKAKKVYGIEYVDEAIQSAKNNAVRNGIANAEFICGDCTEEYALLSKRIKSIDVLIADPPRKGVDSELIENILNSAPNRIVYVSCDPGTLARDLKIFSKNYDIIETTPFDMFPQTTHCEVVTKMKLK